MPGRQPGGKVRISQTAPSLVSKNKVSPSSEVKYYGLIRDEALSDLTSRTDALEEVLKDIQDSAERLSEGEMNAGDLTIIDGIVNYGIKYEDLAVLKGASLEDGNGNVLVNPRQRLADRVSQFETFAGRGTPYIGAGPVKFLYIVPQNGDLLDGTVSINTSGTVTGSNTTFSDDLAVGDFVILTEADGETIHKPVPSNTSDPGIYKVTSITNNFLMEVEPNPIGAVLSGKKLRKRYCHNNPPPFYTENIDSTAFNSPDHIPTITQLPESHRQGYVLNNTFFPYKENESWWEGPYNRDHTDAEEYGNSFSSPQDDPRFPIVKDSNISFNITKDQLSQDVNFGVRYDAWFKSGFESNRNFLKLIAQVNGRLKVDYFKTTSISPTGDVTGSWVTLIDTSNPDTFFTQASKSQLANNTLGVQTFYVQGGPDFGESSAVDTTNNSVDLSDTYTDRDGSTKSVFRSNYVPVIIRYWFGQDTVDNSTTSPIPTNLRGVQAYEPSFMIDFASSNITSELLKYWNNHFGFVKLKYSGTGDVWTITGVTQPSNYKTDLSEFNYLFEVVAYTTDATAPTAPTIRNFASWEASAELFEYIPNSVVIAEKTYSSGYSDTDIEVKFPTISSPATDQEVFVLVQNRPRFVIPNTSDTIPYNRSENKLWQRYLYNPDYRGSYTKASDMLKDSVNYIEPDPQKVTLEENPEYFKYKYGRLPLLNTYGANRYDGTIYNRITESNTERDYDYSHSKLLFLGRQKKDTSIAPLATGEIRNKAENYTFIRVEQDAAGNGGEIAIFGRPVNSMAVLNNTAGIDNSGKALHSSDNTATFGNLNRQNITSVAIEYLPTNDKYDDSDNTETLRHETFLGNSILSYVTSYSGSDPIYDTTGVISQMDLGAANGLRNKDIKSIFITSFDKNKGTERFFRGLVSAERRVEQATVTLSAGGIISSATLFSNNDGSITDNNQPYIGALIEFYTASDYTGIPVVKYVSAYNAMDQAVQVTINDPDDLTEGNSYYIRVYYNYFVLSAAVPSAVTTSAGVADSSGFPSLGSTDEIQVRFIYTDSYQFSRVDSGQGLNFAESLWSTANTDSETTGKAFPFSTDTELPAPPSAIVTPFGYDNGPTDPSNPGLGGICYPPYSTQDLRLKDTALTDSELYDKTTGHYDVYFGSPDVSQVTLGGKFLKVTDQLQFDFESSERTNLITETGTFPQFTAASYSHKLRVELSPFIGEVSSSTGLFARTAYTGVTNENIFKDVLKYSNNKPVKEVFFLFAKKASGTGETDISLLTEDDPGWS